MPLNLACIHSRSSSRLRALKGDSNLTLSRPKAEFSICTAKDTPNNQNTKQSSQKDRKLDSSGCYDTDFERKNQHLPPPLRRTLLRTPYARTWHKPLASPEAVLAAKLALIRLVILHPKLTVPDGQAFLRSAYASHSR